MQSTGLISYLMYEDGEIVIDQLSPPERFGDLIDNDTMIYSMSLGKSLGGYLMGHAICKGYINSLSTSLADWPIAQGTLLETATVQDVINSTMGNQKYFSISDSGMLRSGREVGNTNIASIAKIELANSNAAKKRFSYGQFPANIALNYISFKTGHKFNSFINDVLKDHVGLAGKLRMNGKGVEKRGVIQSNFKDLYFSDEENILIDNIRANIRGLRNPYKKALALSALCRACTKKRPRGIFTYTGNRYDDGRKDLKTSLAVSYTHLTLPTNREV